MKLNISKVIEPLDLGEYAEAMRGQTVQVWVNPDRATIRQRELLLDEYNRRLREMNESAAKTKDASKKSTPDLAEKFRAKMDEFAAYATGEFLQGIHEWFANLWSQGSDPAKHWTADELVELNEADPALYQWLKNMSIEMITGHREREKKGSVTR